MALRNGLIAMLVKCEWMQTIVFPPVLQGSGHANENKINGIARNQTCYESLETLFLTHGKADHNLYHDQFKRMIEESKIEED